MSKFKWLPYKTYQIKDNDKFIYVSNKDDFSKNRLRAKDIEDYDLSRFCELEVLKNTWKNIDLLTENKFVVDNITNMFTSVFIIEKIEWDDIGYYLFKVFLRANKEGKIKGENDLGIELDIKGLQENICNEVKKNCLLYDRKNILQMRVNDTLVVYISKSK